MSGDSGVGAANDDAAVRAQVEAVIEEVRPFIRSDGGDLEVISVSAGVVRVRMQGACVGCTSSVNTLQNGIARRLRAEVPGFKLLEAVS
jgi:iron-sulfur cluster assembly protein